MFGLMILVSSSVKSKKGLSLKQNTQYDMA